MTFRGYALHLNWLRKWLKMPNGFPRAQTFSTIFAIIEKKADYILDLSYRNSLLSPA